MTRFQVLDIIVRVQSYNHYGKRVQLSNFKENINFFVALVTIVGSLFAVPFLYKLWLNVFAFTQPSIAIFLFALTFTGLYLFGFLSGILLGMKHRRAAEISFFFWLLQIPVLQTSWITYWFTSGFSSFIGVHVGTNHNLSFSFAANMQLLSPTFAFKWDAHPSVTLIGLDVIALLLTRYFYHHRYGW